MVNYSKGKIYKLVSHHTDKVYIGSTVNSLCNRLAAHKAQYKLHLKGKGKYLNEFELFKLGEDDVKIFLVDRYPCDSKDELDGHARRFVEYVYKNAVNRDPPKKEEQTEAQKE
jgi:glycine cleavage system aminomethyltransferase T